MRHNHDEKVANLRQLILLEYHDHPEQKQNQSVADVSEHNAEQKRKCDCGE